MKKKLKIIPKFKNEDKERDFWAKADTSKYFDFSKPTKIDLSALPIRIYTDEEIDQFVKDDVIPVSLAKKFDTKIKKLKNPQK